MQGDEPMANAPKIRTNALAYLRMSSAANIDGDSATRQRVAIKAYAKWLGWKWWANIMMPQSAVPTTWNSGPASLRCWRISTATVSA